MHACMWVWRRCVNVWWRRHSWRCSGGTGLRRNLPGRSCCTLVDHSHAGAEASMGLQKMPRVSRRVLVVQGGLALRPSSCASPVYCFQVPASLLPRSTPGSRSYFHGLPDAFASQDKALAVARPNPSAKLRWYESERDMIEQPL